VVPSTFTAQGVFGSIAVADDYIKSQTTFTQFYDGFGFYGTLDAFNNLEMYKIKTASTHTMSIDGAAVELPLDAVLATGWNYIPCPFQTSTDLAAALPQKPTSNPYVQDDLMKSQTVFSTFYEGYGWFGNLNTMDPGVGYKLKVATGGSAQYTSSRRRQLQAGPVVNEQPSVTPPAAWKFDASAYPESMTMTSAVAVGGTQQAVGALAAFVGSDVRGVASRPTVPPFGPHKDKPLYQVTIYGNVGESVNFKFDQEGATVALDKTLNFVADANEGNLLSPYELADKRSKLFGNVA